MTKSELMEAMAQRKRRGFIRGRSQVDDWASGFRAAEELVRKALATPSGAVLDPVSVRMAADQPTARTFYDPNLTAKEVCGPFNPRKALDARRNP